MILRSGRAKSSAPPAVRHRLPPLRRRRDVNFSAMREGRNYAQWEVEIADAVALPGTIERFDSPMRNVSGALVPMEDAVFAHAPDPAVAAQQDFALAQAIVQHANHALRAFRRSQRTPVRLVLAHVAATVERSEDDVFSNVQSLEANGTIFTEHTVMGAWTTSLSG